MKPAKTLERGTVDEYRRKPHEVLLEQAFRDSPLLGAMTAEVRTEHTARTINHATVTVYERRTGFRPQAQLALELVGPPETSGLPGSRGVVLITQK